MSIARQIRTLGSETIIYGIAGTIGRFIGIFLVPLYTRVFTPDDYGQIAILTSFTTLLSTFIVLGLDSATGRWFYDGDDPLRRKKIISSWFWCQMVVGVVVSIVVILLSPVLTNMLLGSSQYTVVLIIATLTIPLSTFAKVMGNWLRYLRRAWTTAIFFTLSSLSTIAMVVVFVLVLRRGVAGLFTGQVVAGVLAGAVTLVLIRGWIAPRDISRRLLGEMLVYGLPLIPAALASWVTASADRFILKAYVPTSEIGIYSIGVSLASGIALLTGAFQLAWGPFAFSILSQPDAQRVYSKVLSIYSLFGCWLGTALALFAPQILWILTTPKYYSAESAVGYLVFGYLAIGATYIVAIGCNIAKKSGPVAISVFLGAGVNTAINFAIIPFLGKNGAALSTFLAYAVAAVYLYIVSQKYYHIPYKVRDVVACLALAWAIIGVSRLLPLWGAWVIALRAAMCLLFIPLAFWLNIVRPMHVRQFYAFAANRLRRRAV
jgi:O-antigen/teichoic acid export membrane protein